MDSDLVKVRGETVLSLNGTDSVEQLRGVEAPVWPGEHLWSRHWPGAHILNAVCCAIDEDLLRCHCRRVHTLRRCCIQADAEDGLCTSCRLVCWPYSDERWLVTGGWVAPLTDREIEMRMR